MIKKHVLFFILLTSLVHPVYASVQEASTASAVPGAPTNLVVSISDRSVELTWSPPASNGGWPITDYVIEYKSTVGGTWFTFTDGTNTNTLATVNSLGNDTSYDFRVSAVNVIGQGSASSIVSGTPGAPAQVLIQSFSNLIVPTIGTLVRITNEGSTAYEYTYTWCVTNSSVNLCGGGDDVFSSTAAKLIQSGENFDTTLNSTVGTVGNYYFHINVQFGSDSSEANQSFTSVTAPSGGGGSSSGGGGGGGNIIPLATPSEVCVGADFNHDWQVDSVDFSIMLAFWKTVWPFKNVCVDINNDKQVNSVDFSILLYQWGKTPVAFKQQ